MNDEVSQETWVEELYYAIQREMEDEQYKGRLTFLDVDTDKKYKIAEIRPGRLVGETIVEIEETD